jgi:hypothetical protein
MTPRADVPVRLAVSQVAGSESRVAAPGHTVSAALIPMTTPPATSTYALATSWTLKVRLTTPAGRLSIPALGMTRAVYSWGCRGGTIPDKVLAWGCSGAHNIYLLGHAYGVFAVIHDAWHTHRLTTGMILWFAGPDGHLIRFRLAWVRHTSATYANSTAYTWAYNATTSDSVTLQTCDGAYSQYRIIVRFVRG